MMKTKVLLILISMFMATSCSNTRSQSGTTKNIADRSGDALLEVAQNRRSVRAYTDEKIDSEILKKITTIGLLAPSSYGQNPVEFVVIEDKDMLREVASHKSIGAPSVTRAAAAIVVCVKSDYDLWIEDASVASAYMLLAAENYGIGACWNHIRGRDGIDGSSADKEIRKLLDIPSNYTILDVIALGHKGEVKAPKTTQNLDYSKVHQGKF